MADRIHAVTSVEEAERLLRDQKISNYAVVDGKAEIKESMEGDDTTWRAANARSK